MKDRIKDEIVRTLGMYQPYAALMLDGKIETRFVKEGRKPPFPLGLYMIYATKKPMPFWEFVQTSGVHSQYAARFAANLHPIYIHDGAPICVGDLVNIRKYDPDTDGPKTFVDSMDGFQYIVKDKVSTTYVLWCLEFENVTPVTKYFAFKGKQGVGKLNLAEKEQLLQAL